MDGTADQCASCTDVDFCTSAETCTDPTDSQCTACAAGHYLEEGSPDLCPACAGIAFCTSGVTCSSANDSQCTACATGYYRLDDTEDSCQPCTEVAHCDVQESCTTPFDSNCATCAAGYYPSLGGAVCLEFTTIPECTTQVVCTDPFDSHCVVCGDGIVDAPDERYDDGNLSPGDGCDGICQQEGGFACSGQPSQCVATIPVAATKLILVDKGTAGAKAVFVAKDGAISKGAGTDVASIGVTLYLAYDNASDAASAGQFVAAIGSPSWLVNKTTVAKYVNKTAPNGRRDESGGDQARDASEAGGQEHGRCAARPLQPDRSVHRGRRCSVLHRQRRGGSLLLLDLRGVYVEVDHGGDGSKAHV